METLEQWASHCDTNEQRVVVANSVNILVRLPFDILDLVFRYCRRTDLSRLCRTSRGLYFITIPSLYRRLEPVSFTDIVRLKKALENGLGPSGIDRRLFAQEVVKGIQRFHLKWLYGRRHYSLSILSWEDVSHQEEDCISYSDVEISRTIVDFICQASNLRSFCVYEPRCLTLSEHFWEAVSRPSLDELLVIVVKGWGCKAISSIKLLHNLRRLHIILEGIGQPIEENPDVDALELLLCSASQLQDLQLAHANLGLHGGGSRIRNSITRLSTLRQLDLRGCCTHDDALLELLCSLPELERFVDYSSDGFSSMENRNLGSMSSLKEVTVRSHYLLLSILKRSRVQTVRNVECLPRDNDQSRSHLCKEFQTFHSIEELGLDIFYETLEEEQRQDLIEALAYIPSSVRFLSIHSQSQFDRDKQFRLSHHKPELDCFRAIDHLVNLERLVLPSNCLLYQVQKQKRNYVFEAKQIGFRATIIALDLKAPKLEYVFFGDNLANDDDHFCRIDPIDAHRRYIVKVTRSPLMEPYQEPSSRSTVQKESNGFYSRLMHRKEEGVVVKAELVSAVCECESCFENQTRYDWEKLHQKYRF